MRMPFMQLYRVSKVHVPVHPMHGSFGHPVLVELIQVKTEPYYFVVMTADRCYTGNR